MDKTKANQAYNDHRARLVAVAQSLGIDTANPQSMVYYKASAEELHFAAKGRLAYAVNKEKVHTLAHRVTPVYNGVPGAAKYSATLIVAGDEAALLGKFLTAACLSEYGEVKGATVLDGETSPITIGSGARNQDMPAAKRIGLDEIKFSANNSTPGAARPFVVAYDDPDADGCILPKRTVVGPMEAFPEDQFFSGQNVRLVVGLTFGGKSARLAVALEAAGSEPKKGFNQVNAYLRAIVSYGTGTPIARGPVDTSDL